MILGLAIGGMLEAFAELPGATLFGALLGVVAANFVPLPRGNCGGDA